jgi:flagellar motor protein MotB
MFRLHTQLALPILLAKILCILLMTGCNQNPFSTSRTGPNWNRNAPEQPPHVTQLAELDRRNRSLDSNNSDLHSRVAQAEQEKQLLQKRLKQAQQLLDETAGDLEAAMADNEDAKKEIEGLYASTKHRGGATIRANSSLTSRLELADIDLAKVTQEDGIIRIQLPADELFHPGTIDLQRDAADLLADTAAAIRRSYPRQVITIEAHTDNSTRRTGKTMHQLSASQALTVHEELVRQHRLPERQFVVTGFGDIAPLVSNATPAGRNKNRRVDLVVHPELFGN